jgi:NAD(P)-dependent dehydrogenase (short-subunit alcohol dehydrogenase family)
MSSDLTGTVALITGATSGIGKATAFALAGRGAHVLVGGRNAARGEAVVTSLRASGAKQTSSTWTWAARSQPASWHTGPPS